MPDASHSPPSLRFAVVGGGVSGLSAAYRLRQLAPQAEVRLFEASDRLGGPLHTLYDGNTVLEQGADSFLTRTLWAVDLCRLLGLADQLVPTSTEHRRALVVRDGKLFPVPEGFVLLRPGSARAVWRSPLLSLAGKLRLLAEPLVPRRAGSQADDDESVASFATRRLGREALERIVQPLVAGIYVADARRLSLRATFPEFLDAEQTHGSLRAARRHADSAAAAAESTGSSSARYGAFVTLRRGMGQLVNALVDRLKSQNISLATPIANLTLSATGQWTLTTSAGVSHGPFDGIILAASAPHAGRMVAPLDSHLASLLDRIEYASSAVVTLVYSREDIAHPLDGFGVVVPAVENRPIVAASFPGVKFPHASPGDLAPIRVFLGGALRPELVDRDDDELIAISKQQLEELLGARGEPRRSYVARWRASMPQYHVGHVGLVDEIERRAAMHRGLALAGNAYRGVGIPQCIHSGLQAAERVLGDLAPES
jgi:oxygen-dependent protoporphyrinogen oxidase